MYTLKFLKLATQDSDCLEVETQAFLPLIPTNLHTCLWNKHPSKISDVRILAIGAFDETGCPLGILLASHIPELNLMEILFLHVAPPHRNQGIGTDLLKYLQENGKLPKNTLITLLYSKDASETPALEKVLEKNGWHQGKPFILRCTFDGFTFNPPWIHKRVKYPAGFKVVPFTQLTETDTNTLYHRHLNGEFASLISPFFETERIEPLNSLVLKHGDRIVAWIITHRLSPDTIRYTALYAERSLQFHGHAGQLLIDSIWLQKNSPIQWAVFELPLRQVTNSWTRFVERRLTPFANETTCLLQAWYVSSSQSYNKPNN